MGLEKELIYGYLDLISDKRYYFGQSDTNFEIYGEQSRVRYHRQGIEST